MMLLLLAPAILATTQSTTPATPQTAPKVALERWQTDPRFCTIGFDAESTLHNFTGKTHAITAELRFDPASVGTCAGGSVWIETRTLDTDNESRDKDMRETLEVAKYPQIVFTLESVEGKLKDLRGEFKARGRFFIRGREKETVVAFRTEPVEGGGMRVLGEAKLKLSDYGVKPPSVVFVTVDDNVRVWFDLRFARAPEKSVPAKVIDVVVHEPDETDVVGRLWVAPSGALWEQPKALAAPWIVTRGEFTEAFLPESATPRAPLPSKETTAPVEKKDTGPGNVVLSVGGVERVTFEGLSGDASFARMLAFVEPLTPDMQTALASVRGVPKRVKIMTPAGGLKLDVVLGAEQDAQFPDWALDPGSWSRAPKPPGSTPKEASGKPAKSGG